MHSLYGVTLSRAEIADLAGVTRLTIKYRDDQGLDLLTGKRGDK